MTSDTTPPPSDAPRIGKVTCRPHSSGWLVRYPVEESRKQLRKRKQFKDEASARTFAENKTKEIADHGVRYGSLPGEVRRAYQTFCEREPKLAAMGFDVPDFETLVRNALDAIRPPLMSTELTVAEAVELFVATKKVTLSEQGFHSLRTRLRTFSRDLGDRAMKAITAPQLEKWLFGLGRQRKPIGTHGKLSDHRLSAHAINHYRAALATFFRHADDQGWVSSNPIKAVKRAASERVVLEVYTPEQVAKVMFAALTCRPDVLPVLALQMFAGLRLIDAAKTDLEDVLFLNAEQSGSFQTSSRGNSMKLPICDALRSWLAVQPKREGLAWNGPLHKLRNSLIEVLDYAGVTTIVEISRLTYLRYRLHVTGDVAQVATEGSVRFAVLESLSRIPVTTEAAESFFTTKPPLDR